MRKFKIDKKIAIVAVLVVALVGVVAWRLQNNASEARWERASAAFVKADYETSARELEGVAVPSDPERLRVYSQTMLATRDLDKALDGYQELYKVNQDPAVQLIIGNIYTEKKQFDDAIRVYQEAIARNPGNTQAYVNLATLYKQMGNNAEAVRVANDAVTNNPGSTTLHELKVSMLLDRKDSAEYRDAVEALRRVDSNSPLLRTLS